MTLAVTLTKHFLPENNRTETTKADINIIQNIIAAIKISFLTLHNKTIDQNEYNQQIKELLQATLKLKEHKHFLSKLIMSFYLGPIEDKLKQYIEVPSASTKFIEIAYLKQGIKTAIAALTVPTIWILFNLPGLSQVAITAIVLMRMDSDEAKTAARDRIMGCCFGVVLGLITLGLDITSFAVFIAMIFINSFALSYLLYCQGKNNYFSLQAGFGYFITAVTSYSYTTDITSGLQRALGIICGMISAKLINENIWPFSKLDGFRLEIEKLNNELFIIMANFKKENYSFVSEKIASCLLHIDIIGQSKLQFEAKQEICETAIAVNIYLYLILIEMRFQENNKLAESCSHITKFFLNCQEVDKNMNIQLDIDKNVKLEDDVLLLKSNVETLLNSFAALRLNSDKNYSSSK